MLQLLLLLPAVIADSFWMTADLLRVDWSDGCLTTAGCSHPRFEILGDLLPLTEKISISWPISEHFVQDTSRSFVSHWAKGKPEDLKLRCQVVGTDPLYGFPRVCDHTTSVRAFPDGIDEFLERRRRQATATTTTVVPEEELGKRLIEIRARCFNATVAVEKHTERCPWCPDPSNVALIEQRAPEDPSSVFSTSIFSRLKSDDKILHASVLILAGISILTSMSFACALVALLRQKRSYRQITIKPRYQPYPASNRKTLEEENRYDMPWEQTLPLTYCLSSSSKSTTTSPLDSTSSFGASSSINPYSFRPGCTIPQTQIYHHISPNSSTIAGQNLELESSRTTDTTITVFAAISTVQKHIRRCHLPSLGCYLVQSSYGMVTKDKSLFFIICDFWHVQLKVPAGSNYSRVLVGRFKQKRVDKYGCRCIY